MDAVIVTNASSTEIAALVVAVQERRDCEILVGGVPISVQGTPSQTP